MYRNNSVNENYTNDYYECDVVDTDYSLSRTENGAVGYRTAYNPIVDLNFFATSLRHMDDKVVTGKFMTALECDELTALKWLFFLRDAREGLGERDSFRTILKALAGEKPEMVEKLITLVPFYGRYDDILALMESPLQGKVISFIKKQLHADMESMNKGGEVSLLAKWLPSENTSSKRSRRLALTLIRAMKITAREYRRMLVSLRKYLDVVEVKLSARDYQSVNYSGVPAKANMLYDRAFMIHDGERRTEYLKSVIDNSSKLNVSGLQPHEIVRRMVIEDYRMEIREDSFAELMWQKLLADGMEDTMGFSDCIVVSDISESMFTRVSRKSKTRAIDVSIALGAYFASKLQGKFHDKLITFSAEPEVLDLSHGESLKEKLDIIAGSKIGYNTDIYAVFKTLLNAAKLYKASGVELPKQILMISDMEFDSYSIKPMDDILFKQIEREYKEAGYKLPKLIFWNVCSRTETIPLISNDNGVALISGFSQNAIKAAGDVCAKTPLEALMAILDSDRYKPVERALNRVA